MFVRSLKRGDRGPDVWLLHRRLAARGYLGGGAVTGGGDGARACFRPRVFARVFSPACSRPPVFARLFALRAFALTHGQANAGVLKCPCAYAPVAEPAQNARSSGNSTRSRSSTGRISRFPGD